MVHTGSDMVPDRDWIGRRAMAKVMRLERTLDLQATGRLAERFEGIRGALQLDASEVAHVGGLAAQLLLAARIAGGPAGKGLTVAPQSQAFADGIRRLGIDPDSLAG
jgi:chemotaxis protein CheX